MNLWLPANLETYNLETESLVGQELASEYIDIIGRLAVAKSAANEALANLYTVEQERCDFFQRLISPDSVSG